MQPKVPYPVQVGTVMLVFDGTHANSNEHLWKLATIIKLEVQETYGFKVNASRVAAQVAWADGSVSSGHFVAAMRYPDSAASPHVQL